MNETIYSLSCPVSFAFLSDLHNADPAPVLRRLQENFDCVMLDRDKVKPLTVWEEKQ